MTITGKPESKFRPCLNCGRLLVKFVLIRPHEWQCTKCQYIVVEMPKTSYGGFVK